MNSIVTCVTNWSIIQINLIKHITKNQLRAEREDDIRPMSGDALVDRGLQTRGVEHRVRQRARGRERERASDERSPPRYADAGHRLGQLSSLVEVCGLVIVVDERHEIDVGERAQRAKQMKGPDAVAAIRGVRQAMREKEDPHRGRTTLAGTPAATTLSGIGEVTTAPAPITLFAPTSAITTAALPIHAPAPMRTMVRSPS